MCETLYESPLVEKEEFLVIVVWQGPLVEKARSVVISAAQPEQQTSLDQVGTLTACTRECSAPH